MLAVKNSTNRLVALGVGVKRAGSFLVLGITSCMWFFLAVPYCIVVYDNVLYHTLFLFATGSEKAALLIYCRFVWHMA